MHCFRQVPRNIRPLNIARTRLHHRKNVIDIRLSHTIVSYYSLQMSGHRERVKESLRRKNKSAEMKKMNETLMKDEHDSDPHLVLKETEERDLDALMGVPPKERGLSKDELDAADGEWKVYKRRYAVRRILRYLEHRESTSRSALFVIGPYGSGKSTTVRHAVETVKLKEPHYLPLEMDFESYFATDPEATREEAERMRQEKLNFDNFVAHFFNPMIARELCKIPQKLFEISRQVDHSHDRSSGTGTGTDASDGDVQSEMCTAIFGVDTVYEILTERMSIQYSMRDYLRKNQELAQIDEIAHYLEQQQRNLAEDEQASHYPQLEKATERHLFQLISAHYHLNPRLRNAFPQYQSAYLQSTCNAIHFAMELLERRELERAINGGRSGTEAHYFFVTALEYLAFRDPFQEVLQPKLFITGLHLLDVFSNGVELRHRDDIVQKRFGEAQDFRGPDLHDHFILRIAVLYPVMTTLLEMYLDPFVPTVVEVEGNYYNYHMIPELKLDGGQVEFVEMLDYTLSESKMLFGHLFREDEFLPIYDKFGGNPSKLKAFYEIYRTIGPDDVPSEYQHQTFKEMKHAMRLTLLQEKSEFDRRLINAYQLLAKYVAQEEGLEQEPPIDDWRVQFRMINVLERIMEVFGTMGSTHLMFDFFAEMPAASALINANILYMQQHWNMCRFTYMPYYTFVADHLTDVKNSWSVSKRATFMLWKRTSRRSLPSLSGLEERETGIWTNE